MPIREVLSRADWRLGFNDRGHPGRDIVNAGFNTDPQELLLIWDKELCDLTKGLAGCKNVTEARSDLGGAFFGFLQEPVPQPHPSPTPAPQQNSNAYWKCLNGWKFSALVGELTKGSRLQGAAQTTASILEIGAPMSTAGDAVATGYKATQTTLGQPQPYASGLNWSLRRMSTGALRGGLTRVGNIAGPVLSGIGAFTAGYNASVAAQCGLGIIR